MFKELDSDSKAFILIMAIFFTFVLLGGLIDAWSKRDGITYVCDGDLIANTATNTYECKPKK